MTIVFRSSFFFVIVVIAVKVGVIFPVSDTDNDTFFHTADRFIDESFRRREEIDRAADDMVFMSSAIAIVDRSVIAFFAGPIRRASRFFRSVFSARHVDYNAVSHFFVAGHKANYKEVRHENETNLNSRPGCFSLGGRHYHWMLARARLCVARIPGQGFSYRGNPGFLLGLFVGR